MARWKSSPKGGGKAQPRPSKGKRPSGMGRFAKKPTTGGGKTNPRPKSGSRPSKGLGGFGANPGKGGKGKINPGYK